MSIPALNADTSPVTETVATDAYLLLQTPPKPVVVKVADEPAHILLAPDIVPETGKATTEITFDEIDTPHVFDSE